MVIGNSDAAYGLPLKFFTTNYRQRDLTLGGFLEIFACKKISLFVNFDHHLHFQSHLLQELDG